MSPVIVLHNLVQFMSQGWSVCHVSETTKQAGAGKSFFDPSFLEKRKLMTYDCVECKVCAAIAHCYSKKKKL